MTTFCKTILSIAVLLLAVAPLALAQGTYTQIDYPGASATEALAINATGDVAGFYADEANNYHGFLLSNGVYTSFSYPGSKYTVATGINDLGQIAGYATEPGTVGFVYDVATQTFSILKPTSFRMALPTCINNAGGVGGYATGSGRTLGFEFISAKYRSIQPPGASNTYLLGIDASGNAVGFYD